MSNINYAVIAEGGVCERILGYEQTLNAVPHNYISIPTFDLSYVGRTWSGSEWSEVVVSNPTEEEAARTWRDKELFESDWIANLNDHPQNSDYISYRVLLRDWPSTADFPATKPTSPASS